MTGFTLFVAAIMGIGGAILCVISVALSFLLFTDVGTDLTSKIVWGGMAIGLELVKFSLVPLATSAYLGGNKKKCYMLSSGFLLLMFVSVLASIGSLAKNTSGREADYHIAIENRDAKKLEINNIQKQIAQRNKSIKRYQELDRHEAKALPLIKENELDNSKLKAATEELELLVIPERSALAEGINSMSESLGINERSAQANVFAVFSILLDMFAALSLIVSEAVFLAFSSKKTSTIEEARAIEREEAERQRAHELNMKRLHVESEKFALKSKEVEAERNAPTLPQVSTTVVPIKPPAQDNSMRVKEAVKDGLLPNPPTARSIIKSFGLTKEEAEKIAAQF